MESDCLLMAQLTTNNKIVSFKCNYVFNFGTMKALKTTLFSFIILISSQLIAQPLSVAVASNFHHTLSYLLSQSAPQNLSINISSGSSGLLYGQIIHGAPYDVFLSADALRPEKLEQKGLAQGRVTYAYGQIVLWPSESQIKPILENFTGKLVIANPKLAPYGVAAQQVLNYLSLSEQYKTRIITANNINQAFQFVDSGNAKLAILSKSQLIHANQRLSSFGEQKYMNFQLIPAHWYSPIAQQAVIVSTTDNLDAAKWFLTWLMSAQVQTQLLELGYGDKSE